MRLLTGKARLAGVIGWPVSHSRSPRIHGAWLERYAIDGAYVPLPVAPENFAAVVRALAAAGFVGANVTVPHKEAAFAICDSVADSARQAGAVNTLVFGPAGIAGHNTDGAGFMANLAACGISPGPALILGAGGAARAIGAALQEAGATVTFCNRTAARAEMLAAHLPGARTILWEDRNDALADVALLINTTTLGMTGQPPLAISLDAARTLAVADIVYAPLETELLAAARARGFATAGGLGMLLHQAVPGFAAWFGVTPVVDADLFAIAAA
jgi:shikimate dehydrogenase